MFLYFFLNKHIISNIHNDCNYYLQRDFGFMWANMEKNDIMLIDYNKMEETMLNTKCVDMEHVEKEVIPGKGEIDKLIEKIKVQALKIADICDRAEEEKLNFTNNILSIQTANRQIMKHVQNINLAAPFWESYELADVLPCELRLWKSNRRGIYVYYLPENFPMRDKDNGRKKAFIYDKNIYYSRYRKGIELVSSQIAIMPFKQKIMAYFLNVYTNKNVMPDSDNVEVKPFIDACIKDVMIGDDNLDNISLTIDGVRGKSNASWVIIGDGETVLSYVKKLLIHIVVG